MRLVAGRGADAGGLGLPGRDATGWGADAEGWGLPGRDATGRGAPLRNGRARRGAEASGRGFRQASARLATACTPGQPGAWLATRCTMGEALHDGQAPPRQGNRWHIGLRAVARYFCLGGALRGYILSITAVGTPRIRCSGLFVAE